MTDILKNQKLFKVMFWIALGSIEYLAVTTQHIEVVASMWDKSNHFIAFFTLYMLLAFGYKDFSVYKKFALLLLFGVQIEVVQYFIPERSFSLFDVIADTIGILIAIVVEWIF